MAAADHEASERGAFLDAIEELLRYESPSPVQARYVTKDVEHHGRPVPAGSAILLLTAAANRDERRFPDADRFDVNRKIDHHLAFGYGIHFCLGSALARLEGEGRQPSRARRSKLRKRAAAVSGVGAA